MDKIQELFAQLNTDEQIKISIDDLKKGITKLDDKEILLELNAKLTNLDNQIKTRDTLIKEYKESYEKTQKENLALAVKVSSQVLKDETTSTTDTTGIMSDDEILKNLSINN